MKTRDNRPTIDHRLLRDGFSGRHVYIHIPVCRYRCDYCDFFTRVQVAPRRQVELIHRISTQADTLIDFSMHEPLETLYVGGGTPSALAPDARKLLLELIARLVAGLNGGRSTIAPEVTVELNPEDATELYCEELMNAGINRLSVGVQTVSQRALATIGRHTGVKATMRGLETIAKRWNAEWSADLIVAIPDEPTATVHKDVQTILGFQPHHASVYELGIEPATVLGHSYRHGRVNAPTESEALAHIRTAEDLFNEAGFRRYEVSSFAHPGAESRHNLAYWRMAPHLGLGPGAVGTWGAPVPHRVTNTRSFADFLGRDDFGMETEHLSRKEIVKEYCMMALRTIEGVDTASFSALAGAPFTEVCSRTIALWPGAFESGERLNTPASPPQGPPPGIAVTATYRTILDRILVDLFVDIDNHGSS